jgi:hypothetical protein
VSLGAGTLKVRKRKRNWPIRVLVYRAYPREVPSSVWEVAKKQRALWNKLVDLWNGARDQIAALPTCKESIWDTFEEWCKGAVAQSGLDWANGPEILERFRTALRGRKIPKIRRTLDRISILHRFMSGGIAIERLIDNTRSKRLTLQSSREWELPRPVHSPNRVHWRARFKVADSTLDCALVLHRAFPPGAFLKRAALVGKRGGSRWFWYLAFTIEEPPPASEPLAKDTRPAAALDLGWRLFRDGSKGEYLRVGMLVDGHGRAVEVRLPVWLRPKRPKERRGLPTVFELQGRAARLLNEGAEVVKNEGAAIGASWSVESPAAIGRRGLIEILSSLPSESSAALKLKQILDEYGRIYQGVATLRFRLVQRRRWYYSNLARWLCQQYSVIGIEDIRLSDLQRAAKDKIAIRNAARYRNYAAVGELRTSLVRTAAKLSCRVLKVAAENSTIVCHLCGAKSKPSSSLFITCPEGHRWDQDWNAAMNLLSHVDDILNARGFRPEDNDMSEERKLDIPEALEMILFEVPA